MLDPEIKARIIAVVEENQPVTAAEVCELLKREYQLIVSADEANMYLLKMRTDFPKRIARSGDRYNVLDLSD